MISLVNKLKILIVDDEPINIQVLYQMFVDDYDVFMATNGTQALVVCTHELPDLVLLDIEMPDINGFEVCKKLKEDELTQDIPIIFVTSHSNDLTESRGLDVGAVDFIAKPYNPRIIRARVKTHLTLKAQSDLLRNWVYIDGLTNLHNRRYFDEHLILEWGRATRNRSNLSLVIADVDFFKQYNDYYGHQAGDYCLQQVAECIKRNARRVGDLCARFGGEEFACILPNADLPGAIGFAEQLKQNVMDMQIPHVASANNLITISIGVCNKPPGALSSSPQELLQLADQQLYFAKKNGRNQVSGVKIKEN